MDGNNFKIAFLRNNYQLTKKWIISKRICGGWIKISKCKIKTRIIHRFHISSWTLEKIIKSTLSIPITGGYVEMKLPRTHIVYQSQVGHGEMKLPRTHIAYQSQVGYGEMKLPRTHIVYQSQVGHGEMKLPMTHIA
jgi:hypothetical protein